jgi:paraquat-inducible protein A
VSQELVACDDCDLVHQIGVHAQGTSGRCSRCGALLFHAKRNSIERSLALTIAGIVLYVVANSFPFLSFEMQGRITETTLVSGIQELWGDNMFSVSGLVFLTAVLAPGVQLALLAYVLVPLRFDRMPWNVHLALRLLARLRPWSMLEVFLIGILVALVKLGDMAEIVPGLAIWSLAVLIVVLAWITVALDERAVWHRVPVASS